MDPIAVSSVWRRHRSRTLAKLFAVAAAFTPGHVRGLGAAVPRGGHGHVMPWVSPDALVFAVPAGSHLTYYGGPVISNVEVIMVLWGSGTYQPFVQSTATPSLSSFYAGVTNSAYLDWLTEYDTNVTPSGGGAGTSQTIGRGTFLGQYTITPSAANDGSVIDDTNIQAELVAQIDAGRLPAPVTDAAGNVNTVYMLHFPQGKTITMNGASSCASAGFCAYHGTIANGGQAVYYGVIPDMSAGSGCDVGCGTATPFENLTSTASHELVEAVTDPAVALATTSAPPLAWYDLTDNMEIGDICDPQNGAILGGDGVAYTVQAEWSNVANACVVSRTSANDFAVSVAPAARQVARGSSATYAVSTAVTSGSAQAISLAAAGLPAGLTASFSPASVGAGASSTLTVTASGTAALLTTAFTITGTAASGPHSTVASVTVLPALAIAPATATLAAGASQAFTASGGSGAGYAWSLATNASGGTIDAASGAYQAGPAGGVTDVVRVTDSLGNTAEASAMVTGSTSGGNGSGGSSSGGCGYGADGAELSLLLVAALALVRAARRTPDGTRR